MIFFFFAIGFFSSCDEPPTPAEKVYLDTLFYKLKGNEKALSIDEQALVNRKDIIRNVWLPSLKDTMPDIRSRMEDELRGMLTAYDYYLDQYLLYQSSTKLLMQDWVEFKKATDGDELSRSQFKERYREMDKKIEENTLQIEKIAKPIYELEPMWMRFERMMKIRGVSSD